MIKLMVLFAVLISTLSSPSLVYANNSSVDNTKSVVSNNDCLIIDAEIDYIPLSFNFNDLNSYTDISYTQSTNSIFSGKIEFRGFYKFVFKNIIRKLKSELRSKIDEDGPIGIEPSYSFYDRQNYIRGLINNITDSPSFTPESVWGSKTNIINVGPLYLDNELKLDFDLLSIEFFNNKLDEEPRDSIHSAPTNKDFDYNSKTYQFLEADFKFHNRPESNILDTRYFAVNGNFNIKASARPNSPDPLRYSVSTKIIVQLYDQFSPNPILKLVTRFKIREDATYNVTLSISVIEL